MIQRLHVQAPGGLNCWADCLSKMLSKYKIVHVGNSMPTDTLFCRPIPDFDEIWQAWGSTEETNPHQVSAHFNHF